MAFEKTQLGWHKATLTIVELNRKDNNNLSGTNVDLMSYVMNLDKQYINNTQTDNP